MVELNWDGSLRLRVGITIYPSHDKAIERVLNELLQHCPARFVLLADSSGLIVSTQGERGNIELVSLASLVAGDMAASQEIARLTGQYQTSQMILREGAKINSFISEAGRYLILFVQVPADVPLGWARVLVREASRQLGEIVTAPADQVDKLDLGLGDKQMSDLAADALDSMWAE